MLNACAAAWHKKYIIIFFSNIGYFYTMKQLIAYCIITLTAMTAAGQQVKPYGPLPSSRQLQWHRQEFYLFVHFGPNTFTDLEWGHGTETEDMFNPTAMDCRQWCRIAKAAGASGIIITAKHHDGFCLWPSRYSKHTVAQSKWRDGKGDVLADLRDACREYGLGMGIYLSPWDRNHPDYGTETYNTVFVNMMQEVVERYGPFFEFWWDGANGEGPNGKRQVYDWHRFESTLRTIAPNTPVFSDIGPDIRWVGNERGIAGQDNWNLLDTAGFTRGEGGPPVDTLNRGNVHGKNWIPAECDVSIRPGWFYHAAEDKKVKSPEQLFDLYLKSVGRGANLLLNVPPNRQGLFAPEDSAALVGFRRLLDEHFAINLAGNAEIRLVPEKGKPVVTKKLADNNQQSWELLRGGYVEVKLPGRTSINTVVLEEPIQMGQRIQSFTIQCMIGNEMVQEVSGTTVGNKRVITFPEAGCDAVRIQVTAAKAMPLLAEVGVYSIGNGLVEKVE